MSGRNYMRRNTKHNEIWSKEKEQRDFKTAIVKLAITDNCQIMKH